MQDESEVLYGVGDVARLLRISGRAVKNRLARGDFPEPHLVYRRPYPRKALRQGDGETIRLWRRSQLEHVQVRSVGRPRKISGDRNS